LLAYGFINVELRRVLRYEAQLIDLDVVDSVLLMSHLLQYLPLLEISLILLEVTLLLRELLIRNQLSVWVRNYSVCIDSSGTLSCLLVIGFAELLPVLRRHCRKPGFVATLLTKYLLIFFMRLSFQFGMLLAILFDYAALYIAPLPILLRGLVELRCPHRLLRLLVVVLVGFVNFEGLLEVILGLIALVFFLAVTQGLVITGFRR